MTKPSVAADPAASITIGVDAHKRTHTLVAIDPRGHPVGQLSVEATDTGHAKALRWAQRKFGPGSPLWAVEDVRMVSSRLERFLMDEGLTVVRVPTKLMARTRASARSYGKSDPIDATAVALAAVRYPDLPKAFHDNVSRQLKLWVDRREVLVGQRTATINRLLWRVHELDPQRSTGSNLRSAGNLGPLRSWLLMAQPPPAMVAAIAIDEIDDVTHLNALIKPLDGLIGDRIRAIAPSLLAIPGCGVLTAAKIVAETASVTRFATESQFANHVGVAPVPDWSSNSPRVRYRKTGQRQLHTALHRIALTQIRRGGIGRPYYDRRRLAGDTHPAALRHLKRRIARVVFNALRKDVDLRTDKPVPAAVP